MNPRERVLLFVLLGILGVGGVAVAAYVWFVKPLRDYNARIAEAEEERDQKELQIKIVLAEKQRLEEARRLSLPANPDKALTEYAKYLRPLLRESGLADIEVQAPPPVDPAKIPPLHSKKAGHVSLPYLVRAKGTLASLVAALERLQRTPVMHRVKMLNIDRADASAKEPTGKLNIQMTVEALLVHGAKPDQQTALKPDTSLGLPTPKAPRQYAAIMDKNVFVGALPPPPPVAQKKETPPGPDDDLDVRAYVRLVSTNPTAQEAHLRNLAFKTRELRIKSTPMSGYDTFRITNEEGTYTILKGKVLRIDQRDVYFLVGEDVYGLHIGQSLADAMRRPLSDEELTNLDLMDLYLTYAEKSEEPEKSKNKGGKSGKKMR